MNVATQALTVLLPVGYLWVAVLFGMAFAGERQPTVARTRLVTAGALAVLHATLFALHGIASGSLPFANTWMVISAIVLTTCVLFVILSARIPQPTVGCFLFGLAALLQLIASAFGPLHTGVEGFELGPANAVHGFTSIVAASAICLSGIYGGLHILLYRQMRAKRFGLLYRQLPNLEQLSRMMRRSALAGFVMLTLGVNGGIALGHSSREGGFSYLDAHVILSMVVWIHFGAIAFSQRIKGFSARRASFASLAGLVTLITLLFMTLVPGLTEHS